MFWTNRIAFESLEFLFEQKHQIPWLLTSNCEMKIFTKLLQVLLLSKQNNYKKTKNKPDTNLMQSKRKEKKKEEEKYKITASLSHPRCLFWNRETEKKKWPRGT